MPYKEGGCQYAYVFEVVRDGDGDGRVVHGAEIGGVGGEEAEDCQEREADKELGLVEWLVVEEERELS